MVDEWVCKTFSETAGLTSQCSWNISIIGNSDVFSASLDDNTQISGEQQTVHVVENFNTSPQAATVHNVFSHLALASALQPFHSSCPGTLLISGVISSTVQGILVQTSGISVDADTFVYLSFFPERDDVTFGSLLLHVCLSSVVCNVRAPYSGG